MKPVYLSLHVRMGDACDERVDVRLPFTGEIRSTSKRKYILPRAYTEPLRRMKSIYNVTDILFATDLQEVIDWALSSMTEFNWHYQDFDRSSLEDGSRLDRKTVRYWTTRNRISQHRDEHAIPRTRFRR
jgi:hypothetical protein